MKILVAIVVLFTSFNLVAQTEKIIDVVNSRSKPVKCKLYFNGINMGYAVNGRVIISEKCRFVDLIDIEPVDTETYDGRKGIRCSTVDDKIIVYSHYERNLALKNAFFISNYSKKMLATMDSNEMKTLYGKLALASNEVYNLDIYPDSIRNDARIQAVVYTAIALSVEDATFTFGDYLVPNDKLIQAVGDFQLAAGLKVTKKIDGKTLQSLAKESSFSVFSEDFELIMKSLSKK